MNDLALNEESGNENNSVLENFGSHKIRQIEVFLNDPD
jgi:hypothetical protein